MTMFMTGDKKINNKQSGFTLLEMLVAVAIFAVVMTMTMSAFLNIVDIQAKAESFRKVNDNLNFAMEAMMREIREGYGYNDCTTPCENISFTSVNGNSILYSKEEIGEIGYIKRTEDSVESRITSESIDIELLEFTTKGFDINDTDQPLVIINLQGKSGKKTKTESMLNLQTTVSQRKLDTGYTF